MIILFLPSPIFFEDIFKNVDFFSQNLNILFILISTKLSLHLVPFIPFLGIGQVVGDMLGKPSMTLLKLGRNDLCILITFPPSLFSLYSLSSFFSKKISTRPRAEEYEVLQHISSPSSVQ